MRRFRLLAAITLVFTLSVLSVVWSERAYAVDNTFYIDCSASTNGDGSLGSPWNTPQALFDHQRPPTPYTFGAGDRVLIRRGTVCNYPIRMIRGSGTPASPVVVAPYGTGARPIINGSNVEVDNWDGPGTSDSSAVQIRDFDNITVEGLELTNTGGGNLDSRRQGVWVLSTEVYGARQNITIRDNYIHNIWGEYKKNSEATAGINIEQRLPPPAVDPTPDPTWYENILIEDNVIEYSNRQGITLWGDWRNRVEDGYNPTGPAWTPWTDVVIQDNEVNHVRGDAIVISNTDGAIIQRNRVQGFNELNGLPESEILAIRTDAQTKQGLVTLPSRNHAGIWTYNADNTDIQFNDVRGGVSNRDGMAYDIDGGSVGTSIQYNYSQDNDGGFLLICGELGQIRDGYVAYNISKNDGYASITTCVGEVLNTSVHNNTIFSTDPTLVYPYYQVDWERFPGDTMNEVRDITLWNNIFSYPGRTIPHFFYNVRDDTGLTPGQVNSNVSSSTNLYHGVEAPILDAEAIEERPYFRNVTLSAEGFELFTASPGVDAARFVRTSRDYFGSSTATMPLNIGAIETTRNDGDGVPDAIEVAGPNGGDGNGDGIPDAVQPNVASQVNAATNQYITIESLDVGQPSGSQPADCAEINSLTVQSATTFGLSNENYPIGFVDFGVTCSSPGDSMKVLLFLDKKYNTSQVRVGKLNGSVFEVISGAVVGETTVGSEIISTVSYTVTDGGLLDDDGVVNGVIRDPVGITLVAGATSGTLSETGGRLLFQLVSGFVLLISSVLLMYFGRRRIYRGVWR